MTLSNRRATSKRKRIFKSPDKLVPTEEQIKEVTVGLTEYYKANPHLLKGDTIEDRIKDSIKRAEEGWECASKNFMKRIYFLTKWKSPSLQSTFGYVDNYYNAAQTKVAEEVKEAIKKLPQSVDASNLRSLLTGDEKKFWLQREQFYNEEFEFNKSSDWTLLLQVLLEELQQYRLAKKRAQNQDEGDNFEIMLNESNRRLIAAQKALGVTREQRENAGKETEGNIAQLVAQYEEKTKLMEKRKKLDLLEEQTLMEQAKAGVGVKMLEEMGLDSIATAMRDAEILRETDVSKVRIEEDELKS